MGLITHNAAVTPAEAEHGHRCTYTLDTLERAKAGDHTGEAMAYRTLAAITLQGEPDISNEMESADYYLKEAAGSANSRQSAHDRAVNRFHLAKLYARRGQENKAKSALDIARKEFTRMDMQWHLAESKKLFSDL